MALPSRRDLEISPHIPFQLLPGWASPPDLSPESKYETAEFVRRSRSKFESKVPWQHPDPAVRARATLDRESE